jgi:hypothetical protein
MSEHRSFPEAANGLPALPMEAELWAAGCDHETARFVARQLYAEGYTLIRAQDIGWPEIRAFQEELRHGQGVREDGGGFFVRCIMALFRRKPDPVENYQQAAARLLREVAQKEQER